MMCLSPRLIQRSLRVALARPLLICATFLLLFLVVALLPWRDSAAQPAERAAASRTHHHRLRRHSRAWWRRYRAQRHRRRWLAQRRQQRARIALGKRYGDIPQSKAEWPRTTNPSHLPDSITRDSRSSATRTTLPPPQRGSATALGGVKFVDRTPREEQHAGASHGQITDGVGSEAAGSTASLTAANSSAQNAPAQDKKAHTTGNEPPGGETEQRVVASAPASDVPAAAKSARPLGAKSAVDLPPEKARPIRVARFKQPPVIDGRLDDEAWRSAAVLKDFYQIHPGDNIQPSRPTEVLLGYDAKSLYIAFRAHDDPGKVRATLARRDAIFDDDTVGVYLDTYNDKRRAYNLSFNPHGVQADSVLIAGGDDDRSIDILMESKGVVTDDGYTVEVAIPFKSLRYRAGKDQLWGVHFFRSIKRFNNEVDSWMPLARGRSDRLSQAGHITGFEGLSTERTVELIPSLTLSETGRRVNALSPAALQQNPQLLDPGRLVNEPIKYDLGLTAKFGITPTVTLDFALNPEFGEVEADQPVVTTNQRFPIFFPEKRPFFLEGREIFQTPLNAVHTRAIVDPDIAVKLSGKRGRNTFGLLLASDNAPGNFRGDERLNPRNFRFLDKNAYIGILRLKRDVGQESSLGFTATSYNFIERHNQLGGFDGRFRFNPQTVFSFQVLGTTSRGYFYDPERDQNLYRTGNGFGYFWSYEKTGRHFGYSLSGQGRTRDYRADVGFTRRPNTNAKALSFTYNSEPQPDAKLISWSMSNSTSTNFDWQGRMQNWGNYSQIGFYLRHETSLSLAFERGYERLFEEEFGAQRTAQRPCAPLGDDPDLPPCTFFGPDPERSAYRKSLSFSGETTPSKKYSLSLYAGYTWGVFDLDFGAGPRYPRVSPAALLNPDAPIDPGAGNSLDASLSFTYQPTEALNATFSYTKSRLVRQDTRRVAFDDNIYSLHTTYQFTRFTFARARIDYDTISANVSGQFLFGWTPSPGTALYVGYNDNLNYHGFNPFTGQLEPGFRRNGRTFFIKMSYLIRRSFSR